MAYLCAIHVSASLIKDMIQWLDYIIWQTCCQYKPVRFWHSRGHAAVMRRTGGAFGTASRAELVRCARTALIADAHRNGAMRVYPSHACSTHCECTAAMCASVSAVKARMWAGQAAFEASVAIDGMARMTDAHRNDAYRAYPLCAALVANAPQPRARVASRLAVSAVKVRMWAGHAAFEASVAIDGMAHMTDVHRNGAQRAYPPCAALVANAPRPRACAPFNLGMLGSVRSPCALLRILQRDPYEHPNADFPEFTAAAIDSGVGRCYT